MIDEHQRERIQSEVRTRITCDTLCNRDSRKKLTSKDVEILRQTAEAFLIRRTVNRASRE